MKRTILTILTVLSLVPFFFSLLNSLGERQVQTDLQLSQTNLVLEAAAWQPSQSLAQEFPLQQTILGEAPYKAALEQYQAGLEELETYKKQLQSQFAQDSIPNLAKQEQQQKQLQKIDASRQSLLIKLGLLHSHQGNLSQAQENWQTALAIGSSPSVIRIVQILQGLWQDPPHLEVIAEVTIKDQLSGWFEGQALERLYRLTEQKTALEALAESNQANALQALIKLALLSTLPILGGVLGIGLVVGLLVQWFLKKEKAVLATNAQQAWETPWDWEVIWQVLVVGFLFLGQIALPLALGALHFDGASLSLRGKAVYVLLSYLAMATGGLVVLFISLKPYSPWPKDWFTFKPQGSALLWGIGGYLTALPLVVLISLINQQIWQGQGGSNPLLFLALKAQDKLVLAIFFFTASILAPIFEEVMFRGFLLPSLTRYFSTTQAIAISAMVFAVAHLNASEVLPLAMLGILLGVVYTRSRNLLSSILLHSLWNSGTLASLFILGSSGALPS